MENTTTNNETSVSGPTTSYDLTNIHNWSQQEFDTYTNNALQQLEEMKIRCQDDINNFTQQDMDTFTSTVKMIDNFVTDNPDIADDQVTNQLAQIRKMYTSVATGFAERKNKLDNTISSTLVDNTIIYGSLVADK